MASVMRTPRVSWTVVEECLDEAEYLWSSWERALDAHDQDMGRVQTWLEERLFGAIDGVLVAGDAGVALLAGALRENNASRASVAAYALSCLNSQAAADGVLQALADSASTLPIRRGLELGASEMFLQRLQPAAAKSARVLAMTADVRAQQGANAEDKIRALWMSPEDDVKAAAVRLAKNASKEMGTYVAQLGFAAKLPEIRIDAMELGLIVGLPQAWTIAKEIVATAQPGFGRAAIAVSALAGGYEITRLVPAFADKRLQREALFAAGFAGTVAAADACLDAMKKGLLPNVAVDSFCAITGLDLAKEGILLPPPPAPDEPVAFEDDDLDADLTFKADDMLPTPDVAAVERWWAENRKRFPTDQRLLGGRPWSLQGLHERMLNAPMRRRHGWAFEIAVQTEGAHQIRTRGFMATQHAQLARLGEDLAGPGYGQRRWGRR
jgi:uncharacterized protein (TIGR02270 family)